MTEIKTNTSSNLETTTPAAGTVNVSAGAQAFDRCRAQLAAVKPEQFVPINVDVKSAVVTVLGSLEEIKGLRAEMATLAKTDLALVDALEDYALSTQEANARYGYAAAPSPAVAVFHEEALKLRETLRLTAQIAAHHGLIGEERLAGFKGLAGYKNVGNEVYGYATMLLEFWPSLAGKVPVTEAQLLDAKKVATDLLYAVGLKEEAPAKMAEAGLARNQAFTLMMRAYDEVRRAVSYLRWAEGDADEIAPSLYAGRVRGRGSDVVVGAEGAEGGVGGGAGAGAGGSPVGNVSPAGGGAFGTGIASPNANPIPPGFPGASPFIS